MCIGHQANAPDLTPNYFFLFLQVKAKLGGQRFSSPVEGVYVGGGVYGYFCCFINNDVSYFKNKILVK